MLINSFVVTSLLLGTWMDLLGTKPEYEDYSCYIHFIDLCKRNFEESQGIHKRVRNWSWADICLTRTELLRTCLKVQ